MAGTNLYLDCFSGICGNMMLGALVDLGVDFDELRDALAGLSLTGYDLACERTRRAGIAVTHVQVRCAADHHHRRLEECCEIVDRSPLPAPVKEDATRTFVCLAEAEAAVHGTTVDEVLFHEVGAVDAIVDIVGTCWALHRLGVRYLWHGPVNLGDGVVQCAHGTYPVPVPAVRHLLAGRPTLHGIPAMTGVGELTTPTGGALLAALARPVGLGSIQTVTATGYGAGDRNPAAFPNCLRVSRLAEDDYAASRDALVELVCDLDDINPEWLPEAADAARAAGAVDVTLEPIIGKGGRPATRMTALCPQTVAGMVEITLFRHTTTFGVRRRDVRRTRLIRRWVPVETPFGTVRVKEGWLGKERLQVSPEHRDCLTGSRKHDVPVQTVYRAALAALPAPGEPPTEDETP